MPFTDQPTHRIKNCSDYNQLLNQEWLLTNNYGGFAMGTAAGANTRRYHGLFIAATKPPVARAVILNQMFEQLILDKDTANQQILEFSTCLFEDENNNRIYAPKGYELLSEFKRGLSIKWVYKKTNITFTRELFLHSDKQAATINYKVNGLDKRQSVLLKLSPMITMRDFHSLVHSEQDEITWEKVSKKTSKSFIASRGDLSATFSCSKASKIEDKNNWWYKVQYPIEKRRGQEDKEDYFVPAAFVIDSSKLNTKAQDISFSVELGKTKAKAQTNNSAKAKRLEPVVKNIEKTCRKIDTNTARCLAIASDDFIVKRTIKNSQLSTIIAGYPWFSDWGRDTFIAMRGLLLTTGRFEQAKQVLKAFSKNIQDGLVPNRFDDYDSKQAHYNTADGSLLFIQAALDYHNQSGDNQSWNSWLAKACISIIDGYIQGTKAGEMEKAPIYMDKNDGLICAGSTNTQLTWMDAATPDGTPFTPRFGKAVEINALWYSDLMRLSEKLPKTNFKKKEQYKKLAKKVKQSFGKLFWDEKRGYLADHVFEDEKEKNYDWSFRPNQIFALCVEHAPLSQIKQKKVLKKIEKNLLTEKGLATLPQNDSNYHGTYTGNQSQRDEAYHQGTIWPWLIGPYTEAILRVGKFNSASKNKAKKAITPLLKTLTDTDISSGALGQLAEIYEADNPKSAVGCPAQAWSVGEVLRIAALI